MGANHSVPSTTADAKIGFFARLTGLLEDQDWAYEVAEKLKNGGLRPLDLAILCQADLGTIQETYRLAPDHLTYQTLRWACEYGGRPGVVSFLARQEPELVERRANLIFLCMSQGPGIGRPTEQDIQTLVEICPKHICWGVPFGMDGTSPLEACLERGYSEDLLDFMIARIPDKVQFCLKASATVRARDTKWLKAVVPKVHGSFEICYGAWSEQVFVDFLGLLFLEKNHIQKLILNMPYSITDDGDGEQQSGMGNMQLREQSSLITEESPGIKILNIDFSKLPRSHAGYLGLLECLPQLPLLEDLRLDFERYDDQLVGNAVLAMLGTRQLKCLKLFSKATPNEPATTSFPLESIFDVLRLDTTLSTFTIFGWGEEKCQSKSHLRLLEVVKENTTLEAVTLGGRFGMASDTKDQMDYYLKLNRCGRKQVTTAVSLATLLLLLGSVQSQLERCAKPSQTLVTSVQYEFLQRSVGKWG